MLGTPWHYTSCSVAIVPLLAGNSVFIYMLFPMSTTMQGDLLKLLLTKSNFDLCPKAYQNQIIELSKSILNMQYIRMRLNVT